VAQQFFRKLFKAKGVSLSSIHVLESHHSLIVH